MSGRLFRIAVILGLVFSLFPLSQALANYMPGTDAFERTWARPDKPVADGMVNRTWNWGPSANTEVFAEPYTEAPNGQRFVQYFDKSRMEDNSYRATPPWDVTNGRLAWELISGEMQSGDASSEYYGPANVQVAGDPHPDTPTYASFAEVLDSPPFETGSIITRRLNQGGTAWIDEVMSIYGVTAEHYVAETDHTVASVFWEFMNSSGTVYEFGQFLQAPLFENPYFVTGYPITEAYWLNVPVGGEWKYVLAQCFERRCLTYTPFNNEGWQVEAGNIGQHYYEWRYGDGAGDEPLSVQEYLSIVDDVNDEMIFSFEWFDELLTTEEIHDTWEDEFFEIMYIWQDLYPILEPLVPPPGYEAYHEKLLDAYWVLALAADEFLLGIFVEDPSYFDTAFDYVDLFIDLWWESEDLRPMDPLAYSNLSGSGELRVTGDSRVAREILTEAVAD